MNKALILCNNDFGTDDSKTANDLVRFSSFYKIVGLIDEKNKGKDAGQVLEGKLNGIPIFSSLFDALKENKKVDSLIIGTLPADGHLPKETIGTIKEALKKGISVVNGLHEFLSDVPSLVRVAKRTGASIIDVRKYKKNKFRRFSGIVKKRKSFVITSVGTDSAVGKMTACLRIISALKRQNIRAECIATGQVAKMSGLEFFKPIDSIPGEFESGELESLILSVDRVGFDILVVEGQGCLSYPPYGSLNFRHELNLHNESNVLEAAILEGSKPDALILTHAPKRKKLSGYPECVLPNLYKEIKLNEMVAGAPVIAITINHENMSRIETLKYIRNLEKELNIPVQDALISVEKIVNRIIEEKNKK